MRRRRGGWARMALVPLLDDELMYVRLNPRTLYAVWAGAAGGCV